MSTSTWRSLALCRHEDPELFAPADYSAAHVEKAVAICLRCPGREPCLNAALADEAGTAYQMRATVRGGLTPRQRAALDRRSRQTAAV